MYVLGMHRSRSLVLAAVLLGIALLAGCSKGLVENRNASSANGPLTCDDRNSWSLDMPISNFLPDEVTFEAADVDCFDWSGVSNPVTAFGGLSIAGSSKRTVRLEPHRNVSRNWTLVLSSKGTSLGRARFSIPVDGVNRLNITTDGAASSPKWGSDGSRTDVATGYDMICKVTPLAPTTVAPTSWANFRELRSTGGGDPWKVGIVSFDGSIAYAQCSVEGSQEWDGF